METLESLVEYSQQNGRVIPRDWNGLWKRLKNKNQRPDGGWNPGLPLILAAWDVTIPVVKQLRFREHLEWAEKENQIEEIGRFLRSLDEEDWFHWGELPE